MHGAPGATLSGAEPMRVQLGGDRAQAEPLSTEGTRIRRHWSHIGHGPRPRSRSPRQARFRGEVLRFAEREPPGLAGRQRRFGPGGDQLGFALGDGSHDVDGEVVGFGHVDGDEADAGFHEAGDDGDVAGEAVELGDKEDPTNPAGVIEGGLQLWPPPFVGTGFDLGKFEDEFEVLTASM